MTATDSPDSRYGVFTLSVDDLGWTKHWVRGRRCDRILVFVAKADDVVPSIHLRAVESKSSQQVEDVKVDPEHAPFDEGIEQVVNTLDALNAMLGGAESADALQDLRFAAFVEHLASVALSDMHPLQADAASAAVLNNISKFSKDRDADTVYLDGVVICTQVKAAPVLAVSRCQITGRERTWPVALVRAGTKELEQVLTGTEIDLLASEMKAPKKKAVASGPKKATGASGDEEDNTGTEEAEAEAEDVAQAAGDAPSKSPKGPRGGKPLKNAKDDSSEAVALADDLFLACKSRAFRLDEPLAENIVVGPTLVSISMALDQGESLRPIEAAVADLAREVGVESVTVSNDPDLPFHVRFLLARQDREFPPLPASGSPVADAEFGSYLPLLLGETLRGDDFESSVSAWPHMLIAGSTGSGKTTFMRSLLQQLGDFPVGSVEVALVDGKREVDYYAVLPETHFVAAFPDVQVDAGSGLEVLRWVVEEEIPRRRGIIVDRARSADRAARERPMNAKEMFLRSDDKKGRDPFPVLMVVIDEFAEIMLSGDAQQAQQFMRLVQQATQIGRSFLVHLVLATQRPDTKVIQGAIKTNLDARAVFRLPTHHDSMTALGGKGAEVLLGRGDFLFKVAGRPEERLQGYVC